MITSPEQLEVEIKKGQQFEKRTRLTDSWYSIVVKSYSKRERIELIDEQRLRVKQIKQ